MFLFRSEAAIAGYSSATAKPPMPAPIEAKKLKRIARGRLFKTRKRIKKLIGIAKAKANIPVRKTMHKYSLRRTFMFAIFKSLCRRLNFGICPSTNEPRSDEARPLYALKKSMLGYNYPIY